MGSMRGVILVLVLLPSFARADDSANRDLAIEYTRLARDAAAAGNCEITRDLGEKVRSLDANHYTAAFVTDEVIAKCLPATSPVPQPTPVAPPTNVAPTPELPEQPPSRPPPSLDVSRLFIEIVLGSVASLGGILGGGLLGALVCADDDTEFGCLGSAIVGAYVGGSVMFGVGVYLGGADGEQTGSLGMAVLGGLLGAAVGILGLVTLGDIHSDAADTAMAVMLVGGPVVGSLIGFNSTRRWTADTAIRRGTPTSLLRFDGNGVSVGIPLVLHRDVRGVPTTTFSLVSGSF
jgi:hypothetical protein